MSLEKLSAFTKKVADLADKPNATMSAAEVKAHFDAAPDEVRVYLNKLIDVLQSVVDGDSGADNIGVTPISSSPDKLQGMLEWLKTQTDGIVLGQIPDGSLTPVKLSFNPSTKEELDEYILNLSSLTLNKGASLIGIHDVGGYYESENVEGALQKIGQTLYTPKPKVYGIRIDINNSDPLLSVGYSDDASGFTSQTDFANVFPFNQIKPCVLRNGIVQYYLNPDNWAQKSDGTPSGITDYAPGDVMIEFPKLYWSITRDINYIRVRYSESKADDNFVSLAHSNGNTVFDKVYISAYAASLDADNKLRSASGKAALLNNSLANYRTYARNNGSGYNIMNYYQVLMLQVLYLVRFANRNSRGTVGLKTFNSVSGTTDAKGMNVILPATGVMKLFGIEQLLNDIPMKVDGAIISGGLQVTNNPAQYSDAGSGYEALNATLSTTAGYIREIVGSNKGGFLPTNNGGSATTHYPDMADLSGAAGNSYHFGNNSNGGIFSVRSLGVGPISSPNTYSRLVYLGSGV